MCTVHFEEGLRPKHCVIQSKNILLIAMQSDPLRSVYSTHSVEIASTQRAIVRDSPHSSNIFSVIQKILVSDVYSCTVSMGWRNKVVDVQLGDIYPYHWFAI